MIAETVGTKGAASPSLACEWQWGWALAVAANLPIPLLFGLAAVAKGGLFGMCAGIGAFWLAGAVVMARVPRMRRPLVYGGCIFALSQFFPVAQLVAGAVSLELFGGTHEPMSEPAAFLATVVTGGQLLLVVLIGGLFFRAIVGPAQPPQQTPV